MDYSSQVADKLIRIDKRGEYVELSIKDRQLQPLVVFSLHEVEAAKLAKRIVDVIEGRGQRSVEGIALGPAPTADQLVENMDPKPWEKK
jgi:hypothetical protein